MLNTLVGCKDYVLGGESPRALYRISVVTENSTSYECESEIEYTHTGESTLTKLIFHLYPNASDIKGGKIEISGTYIDDSQVGFSLDGDRGEFLVVPLIEELFPNEKVVVKINYHLSLPQHEGRYGASGDTVRLSGFYPALCVIDNGEFIKSKLDGFGDYYFSKVSDFEVRLTTFDSVVVASSGKRVSTIESDGKVTHTYKGEKIRDFAFCLSEKYHTVSAVYGATLITAYGFSEEESEKVLSIGQKAFALFSEKYGKYNHPTFSIALCELDVGGMEYDGVVYVDRTLKGMDQERVIAHETAHEWWYGAVGSNPTEYAWLDEGLAEYSVMEYIEKYYGREQREKDIQTAQNAYTAFCSALKSIKGKGDLPLTQSVTKFNSLYEYVTVTYTKGMLFYQNLRSILGEKRLDNGLKKYYSYFNGKIATPRDLQETLGDSARLDLAPVFRAWEEGKVYFGA